jgi:hypothetical protein
MKKKQKKTNGLLRRLLAEPATAGLDLDAPSTTIAARALIQSKPFLRRVYDDWYARLSAELPSSGAVLELGSGGGFLSKVLDNVIASDVQPLPYVDVVLDAGSLPFQSGTLRGIAMTNGCITCRTPGCFSPRPYAASCREPPS